MHETKNESYVYVIECGGFIKVGATSDLNKRIDIITSHNPYEITLIESFCYKHRQSAFLIESKMHDRLKKSNKHHKFEWFIYDEESLLIISSVVKEFNIEILEKANNTNRSLLLLKDMIISEKGVDCYQVSKFLKEINMPVAANTISNGRCAAFNIPEENSDEACLNYIIDKLSKLMDDKNND